MASSLDGPIRLVCFSNHPPSSPFHGYLATSTFNRVTVYDVKTDRVVRRFSAIDAIAGMAFNPYTADCEADDAAYGEHKARQEQQQSDLDTSSSRVSGARSPVRKPAQQQQAVGAHRQLNTTVNSDSLLLDESASAFRSPPSSCMLLLTLPSRSALQILSLSDPSWHCRISPSQTTGLLAATWCPDGRHVVGFSDFGVVATVWSLVDRSEIQVWSPKSHSLSSAAGPSSSSTTAAAAAAAAADQDNGATNLAPLGVGASVAPGLHPSSPPPPAAGFGSNSTVLNGAFDYPPCLAFYGGFDDGDGPTPDSPRCVTTFYMAFLQRVGGKDRVSTFGLDANGTYVPLSLHRVHGGDGESQSIPLLTQDCSFIALIPNPRPELLRKAPGTAPDGGPSYISSPPMLLALDSPLTYALYFHDALTGQLLARYSAYDGALGVRSFAVNPRYAYPEASSRAGCPEGAPRALGPPVVAVGSYDGVVRVVAADGLAKVGGGTAKELPPTPGGQGETPADDRPPVPDGEQGRREGAALCATYRCDGHPNVVVGMSSRCAVVQRFTERGIRMDAKAVEGSATPSTAKDGARAKGGAGRGGRPVKGRGGDATARVDVGGARGLQGIGGGSKAPPSPGDEDGVDPGSGYFDVGGEVLEGVPGSFLAMSLAVRDGDVTERDGVLQVPGAGAQGRGEENEGGAFLPRLPAELPHSAPDYSAPNPKAGVQILGWCPAGRLLYTLEESHPTTAWIWDFDDLGLSAVVVFRNRIRDVAWSRGEADGSSTLAIVTGTPRLHLYRDGCLRYVDLPQGFGSAVSIRWLEGGGAVAVISRVGKGVVCHLLWEGGKGGNVKAEFFDFRGGGNSGH